MATLAREWAIPGMAGFEHRVGGLEKNITGTVSHDPENHQKNCEAREEKVQRVVDMVPDLEVCGDEDGDVLVVGWGVITSYSIHYTKLYEYLHRRRERQNNCFYRSGYSCIGAWVQSCLCIVF